jgi:CubicO group peptidase (beta-lactamase class C family)
MPKKRIRTWLALITGAAGLLMVAAILVVLGVFATPIHRRAQDVPSRTHSTPSPTWADAVERGRQTARTGVVDQNLPGLSVAVGAGGHIVWSEGFGWADLETRAPVTPDTQFRIGTASTVLTSAAIGRLLEKDQLKLDQEIQIAVPQFPTKPWPVTLRQLMGHVAGVSTDSEDGRPLSSERCERPVDALPHFADRALLFEPGTKYRLSKYGWILVSAAVEAAGGQPFLTFIREQIFQPLGMHRTGAESATEENPERVGEAAEDMPLVRLLDDVILKPLGIGGAKAPSATDRATFYAPGFGPDPLFRYHMHVMLPRNRSCYTGAMAFLSTPADLVRFGLAIDSGKVLQLETVQLLQTSLRLTSGEETGYGLGWDVETVTLAGAPTRAAGHDGESFGEKMVSFIMFRERGIVVAVMSNTSYADTRTLALKIAAAFAERASNRGAPALPPPREATADHRSLGAGGEAPPRADLKVRPSS